MSNIKQKQISPFISMKKLQTCPTKASTPIKDDQDSLFISGISKKSKRRHSFTVYSALKDETNKHFNLQHSPIKFTNRKLQLHHFKQTKQISNSTDHSPTEKNRENGGIVIKMNLCGDKFCDISIENSWKLNQDDKNEISTVQKNRRVLYMTKKKEKKHQQVNSLKEQYFTEVTCKKINDLSKQNQSIEKAYPYQMRLESVHRSLKPLYVNPLLDPYESNPKISRTAGKLQFQKTGFYQSRNTDTLEISNSLSKDQKFKKSQKQENTKSNSFSIRNLQTQLPIGKSSFESFSQGYQYNMNFQNIEKLKEIYQNSQRSSNSYNNNDLTAFNYQLSEQELTNKQNNLSTQPIINIRHPEQRIEEKLNFRFKDSQRAQPHSECLDSARSIIQILEEVDSKSPEIDQQNFSSSFNS